MSKKEVGNEAIYDAKVLGTPKMLVLGFQHLFAMFGATVLVPIITGLSVSTTLLFAGIATLFMHFVTGRKVPVFLGSSFAFLGGYAAVKQIAVASGYTEQQGLVYACLGVACAGALLSCMYPELGLRVINMGISGNQVRDLKDRWQTDVIDLKPDWVSVLIGINDVWRQFDSPYMPETHVLP